MPNLVKKVSLGVAGLAALALGGSALAGAAGSSSTTPTPTPGAKGGAPGAPGTRGDHGPPPGFDAAHAPGTAAHEAAEKPVTGQAADKAKAAAQKAVPGKAGAVTTDFGGHGYEVDVTKSDGTKVTVHLDSSFNVMRGPGGPGGPGQPGHGFGRAPYGGAPPSGKAPQAGPPPGQEPSAA